MIQGVTHSDSSQNGNGCTGTTWEQGTCLKVLEDELVPNYIPAIPADPLHGHTPAGYRYCGGPDAFEILILHERADGAQEWCSVQHQANFESARCWTGAGDVPGNGWCHEEM